MKPLIHAEVSAKRFGGKPDDYLAIHELMDSSKLAIVDNRHRALTHNGWFVETILKRIFGATIKNSDGKTVFVQDIGEQHCMDDFGYRFIPTAQDYLEEMEFKSWMADNGPGEMPSSTKRLSSNLAEKFAPKRQDSSAQWPAKWPFGSGIPNQYPLAIQTPLDRAFLAPRSESLYDTEWVVCGRDQSFFKHPVGHGFDHRTELKTASETNLNQSAMLDYPREFFAQGIAVILDGDCPLCVDGAKFIFKLDRDGEEVREEESWVDIPICPLNWRPKLLRTIRAEDGRVYPENSLLSEHVRLFKSHILVKPGQPFGVELKWGTRKASGKEFRVTVSLCGTMLRPL